MGDFMDIIKERRSVRSFEEKDVPDELLRQALEAVRWSPSWANTQCWEIVIVKDQGMKQKLQDALAKGNPATKAMEQAPVILSICGKTQSAGYYKGEAATKFGDWMLFDLGIATQSLCLAAHDLGLGSVVVGMFDHDKVKEVLGLPAGYESVALIPIGYPAKTPSPPKRKDVNEFVHYEKF